LHRSVRERERESGGATKSLSETALNQVLNRRLPIMSKRRANVQLTKDDRPGRDDDDSEEEPVSRKATAEQMKQRRIVRARRPAAATTAASAAVSAATASDATSATASAEDVPTAAPVDVNPSTEEPKEEEKEEGNVFANVDLTSSNVFGASTSFSGFGSAPAATTTPLEPKKSVFGSSVTSFQGFGSTATSTATETTAKSFGGFAAFSTATTSTSKPFVFTSSTTEKSDTNNADTATAAAALVLPNDYVVQSGEEQEEVLYESRAKAYRWGIPTITTTENAAAVAKPEAPSVPPSEMLAAPASSADNGDKQEEETEEKAEETVVVETAEEPATATTTEDTTTTPPSKSNTSQWIEVGVGPVRVLIQRNNNSTIPSFGRLVQRRQPDPKEKATKLLVNCNLGRESTFTVLGDCHVQIATPVGNNKCLQFLFKFPSVVQAKEFQKTVQRVVQSSKSFLDGDDENDNHGKSTTKEEEDANPQS
jgi:hypothetical protein